MSGDPGYVWIDARDGLRQAVRRLSRAAALGIDTEADSFYHYFHKCCLIQISDGETVFLIDPLKFEGLDPLGELLVAPHVVKVLHAAEQDVLYIKRDYGFRIVPLFDTMIAAQLLGKHSIGLASLLGTHFNVKLDKGCQRDDWSRRPLSERQKAYAAEDVRHLVKLRDRLEADLRTLHRLEWAEEEFELVSNRSWEPRDFHRDEFWSLKGTRDLTPREAAILRELYAMRDERARTTDLPPFRIASDEVLLQLARRAPRTLADTDGIKGLTPLVRRRIGAQILAAVRRGQRIPEGQLPSPPKGRGRRRAAGSSARRLERLREWRRKRAAELGLDPGVLVPQSTLEALASAGTAGLDGSTSIPGLREWRRRLLVPEAEVLLA